MFRELLINNQITSSQVRLVGAEGEALGVMSISEATKLADEANLDLALISPNSTPVVCKLMDYGKYKFDSIKKEKELKKNQKVSELKEIQLSMTIDKHDMEIKAKRGIEFLKDGDKVKIALRMKGREQAYTSKAVEVVKSFEAMLSEFGVSEKQPDVMGKNIYQIMSPKK